MSSANSAPRMWSGDRYWSGLLRSMPDRNRSPYRQLVLIHDVLIVSSGQQRESARSLSRSAEVDAVELPSKETGFCVQKGDVMRGLGPRFRKIDRHLEKRFGPGVTILEWRVVDCGNFAGGWVLGCRLAAGWDSCAAVWRGRGEGEESAAGGNGAKRLAGNCAGSACCWRPGRAEFWCRRVFTANSGNDSTCQGKRYA
jgi:hypothetical protein